MKELLQNLGIIIVVIAAVLLVLSHFLGWNNINAIQFGAFGAMIVGVVLYIWLNKKHQ
jgi:membrane associated rhomboid family serine protease